MGQTQWDLLYIHPTNHPEDAFIPAGVLANYNRVSVSKRGFYAFEVPDEAIRGAKLIGMTLHWGIAYDSLKPIIAHIRRVNPRVKILLGGISASFFAPILPERLEVDYVLFGDGEPVFPALVEAVLSGREPDGLPNLVTRKGGVAKRVRLAQEDFDSLDTLNCDWFPSYERLLGMEGAVSLHLFASRGCCQHCDICYGSHAPQSFGPGIPTRSPEAIFHDMQRMQERYPHGNLAINLFSLAEESRPAYREIFSKPWTFSIAVNMCSPFDEEMIHRLADHAASSVAFSFTWPEDVASIRRNPDLLEREIATLTRIIDHLQATREDAQVEVYFGRGHSRERLNAFRKRVKPERLLIQDMHYFEMTRPMNSLLEQGVGLDEQLDAVADLSRGYRTIRLARLASPAMRRWLEPVGTMDGHFRSGWEAPPSEPGLRPFWESFSNFWARHSYAGLPGLRLGLLPCKTSWPAWSEELPLFNDWGLEDHYRLEGSAFLACPPKALDADSIRWTEEQSTHKGLEFTAPSLPENIAGFALIPGLEQQDGKIIPFLPEPDFPACFISMKENSGAITLDLWGNILCVRHGSHGLGVIALDGLIDYVHPSHPRPYADSHPKELYEELTEAAYALADVEVFARRLDERLRDPAVVKYFKGARCTEVKVLEGATLGLRFERPDNGELFFIGVQALREGASSQEGLRCQAREASFAPFCRFLEKLLPRL